EGRGQHLLPAFFDPHAHLRVPGQEHKEDIETGTRAAAAGGYAAVLAMPNTDPVLDSAPLLRSLHDAAAREARVSVGFLAAITIGSAGERLTEMAEMRDFGALGFTDDCRGVPKGGISCAATPHHLRLSDEDARTMATRMKLYPPLAGAEDRRALVDGLRAGTIDCVASDHAPHAREEKEVPFEQAPMGTTGLETAFAALYTGLVLPGSMDLALLVE